MSFTAIDGYMLRRFIVNGANLLIKNRDKIDALNVFPVPDGDTGTNMSMTVKAASDFVEKLNSPNAYEVAKAAANGALRGARGNSGVILSQVFRGLAKGLEGKATADCKDLAYAIECAKDTAYKAVMKPKEGTILTIIRALADKAQEASQTTDSIEDFLSLMLSYAESVLETTPDMLPQLKQAGVVDAGGKGLLLIVRGGYESIGIDNPPIEISSESTTAVQAEIPSEEIKFGYCTEFFVNLTSPNSDAENELKSYLSKIGDSLVVVGEEDFIKVHVHTDNPGLVLERALKIGSLDKIKIENMRIQHTNLLSFSRQAKEEPKKDYGFAAVVSGEGLEEIFKDLGCDRIITGGQTMNPSTEDILAAVNAINADTVFVLPNNKNIILAANQAAQMCSDKKVIVIESTNIPQGISAMIAFIPTETAQNNYNSMKEAMELVAVGQATYAVRSTRIDEHTINEGDYLFMSGSSINNVDTDLAKGCIALVSDMIKENPDCGLVTIYYGQDVSEKDAHSLAESLENQYEDIEFEIHRGGQAVYYYIISVE